MKMEPKLDERGLYNLEPTEKKNITFADAREISRQMESQMRPLHEFVGAVKLTRSNVLGEWVLLTPNGHQIAITEDALKGYASRICSPRQPAVIYMPVAETESGLIALNGASDQYGLVPNSDLFETVERAVGRIIDRDVRLNATISPQFTKFTVLMGEKFIDTPQGEDGLELGVQLYNSHTGGSSVKLRQWAERMVCTNGLIVRGFQTSVKVIHRWAGLTETNASTWFERISEQFLDGDISSLPVGLKNYLAEGSRLTMRDKLSEIEQAIREQYKNALKVAEMAQGASRFEPSTEEAKKAIRQYLDLLTDEDKAEELRRRFGIEGTAVLRNNSAKLRRVIKQVEDDYFNNLGVNGWAIAQVFNDQPTLEQVNFPTTGREKLEQFSGALTHYFATIAPTQTA